jgi:putative membrane protein
MDIPNITILDSSSQLDATDSSQLPLQIRQRKVKTKDVLKKVVDRKLIDMQGSEARDLLANERTFLAWLRTGFATVAVGFLINRQSLSNGSSQPETFHKILSLLYNIIGLLCILAGVYRYGEVKLRMEENHYPTGGLLVTIITLFATVVIGMTIVFLLL